MSVNLGSAFYFCTPYHSWECGLNENTNGLVRKYLLKDIDFAKLTAADLQRVKDLLKNRPLKALDYHSPNEAFAKMTTPPKIYALGM
jgi:IS30 family transposase